ncbi:MAG: pyrroline-5-carboxylate reductase [Mariprofundaceae bacterium]
MQDLTISFIGGGNMAEGLISGLVQSGHPPASIIVSDINPDRPAHLHQAYNIVAGSSNGQSVAKADVLLLAVKPQAMEAMVKNIKEEISASTTVISIAAGIGSKDLQSWLGAEASLVRAMPNTPCLVGAGMSVLFARPSIASGHRSRAEYVLSTSGEVAWVEKEKLLHAVTAISGSGPGYYFLLSEVIEATAVSLGLSEELASKLVRQTAFGSGKMLVESGRSASELRQQVTSPGGTTQEALDMMYDRGLLDIIRAAVQAAEKRSKELT